MHGPTALDAPGGTICAATYVESACVFTTAPPKYESPRASVTASCVAKVTASSPRTPLVQLEDVANRTWYVVAGAAWSTPAMSVFRPCGTARKRAGTPTGAGGGTVTLTVVVCVPEAFVPVTVTTYGVPGVAVGLAATVRIEGVPDVTDAGLTVAVTPWPVDATVTARATEVAAPLSPAVGIELVRLLPCGTISAPGLAGPIVKSRTGDSAAA